MGALLQGKPCLRASSMLGSMAGVTGRAVTFLATIRTAGQGWDPPKQVGPEHLAYRTDSLSPRSAREGSLRPEEQGKHGEVVRRCLGYSMLEEALAPLS